MALKNIFNPLLKKGFQFLPDGSPSIPPTPPDLSGLVPKSDFNSASTSVSTGVPTVTLNFSSIVFQQLLTYWQSGGKFNQYISNTLSAATKDVAGIFTSKDYSALYGFTAVQNAANTGYYDVLPATGNISPSFFPQTGQTYLVMFSKPATVLGLSVNGSQYYPVVQRVIGSNQLLTDSVPLKVDGMDRYVILLFANNEFVALDRNVYKQISIVESIVDNSLLTGAQDLTPAESTYYLFGTIPSLTLYTPISSVKPIVIWFSSGATPTTLTIPITLKIPTSGITINANRSYELSIVNRFVTLTEFS